MILREAEGKGCIMDGAGQLRRNFYDATICLTLISHLVTQHKSHGYFSFHSTECVGLGFPHDVIQTPDYIWNDRIAVKLTVHLD